MLIISSIPQLNEAGGGGKHSDAALVQYLFQVAHGTDIPFYGWIILGLLRLLSYLYEFGGTVYPVALQGRAAADEVILRYQYHGGRHR